MFDKNDKTLKIVRIAMYVIIGICAVWITVDAIRMMMGRLVEVSLRFLFIGLLACAVSCFILELIYSVVCDIKLIRNKLYGKDNDGLSMFLDNKNSSAGSVKFADELRKLKELYDAGAISEEEYNEGKKRILSDK